MPKKTKEPMAELIRAKVSTAQRKKLKATAKRSGYSESYVIRAAIDSFLNPGRPSIKL